jgi:hypothetical protein
MPYFLKKYGNDIKTIPERTRIYIFEIKYGDAINPRPQRSGITAFCFLP